MAYLLAGLVLFFGVHSIAIVAPAWRDAMATRLGEGLWKGLYALASLAGFVLLVHGYLLGRHDPHVLYTTPPFMRDVTALLMLPVFPLLFAAYLPGRIQTTTRHPMLVATKTWAFAHLLVNGALGDVLLFGGFLAWAVADRIAIGRRAVVRRPRGASPRPVNDWLAVVGGLVVYIVFVVWGHQALIGVSPLLPR